MSPLFFFLFLLGCSSGGYRMPQSYHLDCNKLSNRKVVVKKRLDRIKPCLDYGYKTFNHSSFCISKSSYAFYEEMGDIKAELGIIDLRFLTCQENYNDFSCETLLARKSILQEKLTERHYPIVQRFIKEELEKTNSKIFSCKSKNNVTAHTPTPEFLLSGQKLWPQEMSTPCFA